VKNIPVLLVEVSKSPKKIGAVLSSLVFKVLLKQNCGCYASVFLLWFPWVLFGVLSSFYELFCVILIKMSQNRNFFRKIFPAVPPSFSRDCHRKHRDF